MLKENYSYYGYNYYYGYSYYDEDYSSTHRYVDVYDTVTGESYLMYYYTSRIASTSIKNVSVNTSRTGLRAGKCTVELPFGDYVFPFLYYVYA